MKYIIIFFFFFFKQKTAYEITEGDWSSDVCSSDLDSGEAAGLLYYVTPYVEGKTLRDRLQRDTRLPLDEALQIVREVADALEYAHQRGVVHRDIKPENILF